MLPILPSVIPISTLNILIGLQSWKPPATIIYYQVHRPCNVCEWAHFVVWTAQKTDYILAKKSSLISDEWLWSEDILPTLKTFYLQVLVPEVLTCRLQKELFLTDTMKLPCQTCYWIAAMLWRIIDFLKARRMALASINDPDRVSVSPTVIIDEWGLPIASMVKDFHKLSHVDQCLEVQT